MIFGFRNLIYEFRFVKINLVLLFLNVYHVVQKIVKFLSEMSVFCQNLWYNVYSDISKGEVLTRLFVSIVP